VIFRQTPSSPVST